jgi:hypothetical protein
MVLNPIFSLLGIVLAPMLSLSPSASAAGTGTGLAPYVDPPFADSCVVHPFGEGEVPGLSGLKDDPLCVDYAKRDITLTNGGAIRFLIAEPARFAIVAGKCSYWQQDHWSVQGSRGQIPMIRWDGNYWFDLGSGRAGARLTDLTIGGQPATIARAAAYVAPYSPALAAYFLTYGQGGDGASFNAGFPFNPLCPR